MALSCKREAFKLDAGCPSLDVDLTFPDFESCEVADASRLKGVAKLDLQKSPAFPVVIPANDPLPVVIPDIDVEFDYECSFSDTEASVSFSSDSPSGANGDVSIVKRAGSCAIEEFKINLSIPNTQGFVGTIHDARDSGRSVENPFDVGDDMLTVFVPVETGSFAAIF